MLLLLLLFHYLAQRVDDRRQPKKHKIGFVQDAESLFLWDSDLLLALSRRVTQACFAHVNEYQQFVGQINEMNLRVFLS